MKLYLAKTLIDMKKYGPTYDLSLEPEDRVETYDFEVEDGEWLLDHVVDGINATCDTLLDDGDVDYIGAEYSKNLIDYLSQLDLENIPDGPRNVITKLIEYAERAEKYGTGLAIEF
ncbi:MAG: hypothetical protein J5476_10955 [Lachnospiraceae bacterium]|nr:hypothetical protein [Lachnospiraceae bacterium]